VLYDISPPISEKTAVWPGDKPFERHWAMQTSQGLHMDLSAIHTTLHIGAHADAPSHYHAGAATIDQIDLDPYLGPCWVIEKKSVGLFVTEDDYRSLFEEHEKVERILFRTNSQPDTEIFNADFVAFAPEAVEWLGQRGVKLLGIDTASVDPFTSKTLTAHKTFLKYGIRNLEGLVLTGVPEGRYELIALPLKIAGADASPVRAVLRTLL